MTDGTPINLSFAQPHRNTPAEKDIRDLMGLLALPALWAGRDSQTILQIMFEAAERIVPLRFTYAQVVLPPEQSNFDLLRVDGEYLQGDATSSWEAAAQTWTHISIPDGRGFNSITPLDELRVVRLSMGYGPYGGKIWFGSAKPDFPTVTQLAFLRAAASLATTGLQTARSDYERAQASRAKDEFLAMLGHELRNPLAPIVTALELLKIKNNGDLSHENQIIERQANHLSRLVDDLLDVTRITRGKVELKKQPVDLQVVLARAIESTQTLLHERQHQLTTDFPDKAAYVFGDVTRLTQVFCNLLTNAAKYTEPGGKITVVVSTDETHVSAMVQDNGSGISPHMHARLFNIFEQGVATIDRAKGGLGIGLALVKNFVDLHDGSVAAHSPGIGCGSTFTVRFPLLTNVNIHSSVGTPPDTEPARSLRVLVVDDNTDALETVKAYLHLRGHLVNAVTDPIEALNIVDGFEPEVAVLDIGLPLMDGYALASELRKKFSPHKLRLVALTGYGQLNDMERSRKAGFDIHLVKPVAPDDLDAAMVRLQYMRKESA